jgi:hypothetical protein
MDDATGRRSVPRVLGVDASKRVITWGALALGGLAGGLPGQALGVHAAILLGRGGLRPGAARTAAHTSVAYAGA